MQFQKSGEFQVPAVGDGAKKYVATGPGEKFFWEYGLPRAPRRRLLAGEDGPFRKANGLSIRGRIAGCGCGGSWRREVIEVVKNQALSSFWSFESSFKEYQ